MEEGGECSRKDADLRGSLSGVYISVHESLITKVLYISKMSYRLALLGLLELVTPVILARQFSASPRKLVRLQCGENRASRLDTFPEPERSIEPDQKTRLR